MTFDQRSYQRETYDRHYPQMAASLEEQHRHPILRSFYDRLARRILGLGLDGTGASRGPVRLFEAGCGEGLLGAAILRVAAERGIDLVYTGSDISAAGLELARPVLGDRLLLGDAVEVTARLAPGSQDLVVAKNLLHHLDHPAEFLRHAAKAVGPNGAVVAIDPRLWCPVYWVCLMWGRQERYLFHGHRRNVAAFRDAGLTPNVRHAEPFSLLPFELAFATRFRLLRRLFGTSDPRRIGQVSDFDDWLASNLPWLSPYYMWVAAGS